MADQPDNIFGSTTPTPGSTGTEPNANSNDHLATMLGSIKNERGEPKYKTLEEALKALGHAQEFIPKLKTREEELEQELQTLRAKVAKVDTLEATVLELTQRGTPKAQENQPAAGLTAEEVAKLVQNTLNETQTKAEQTKNTQTVVSTMKGIFGDKASEVYDAKAKELGISVADLNAMAAKSPQVVLKLMGADNHQQTTRQPAGFNTMAFQPQVNSNIGRSKKTALTGATNQDLQEERKAANAMVDELHAAGKSVHDLTDPKVYFKHFG